MQMPILYTDRLRVRPMTMRDLWHVHRTAVMQRLGMTITHNPSDEPRWLQVVGVLENHNEG